MEVGDVNGATASWHQSANSSMNGSSTGAATRASNLFELQIVIVTRIRSFIARELNRWFSSRAHVEEFYVGKEKAPDAANVQGPGQ